MAIKVLFLCIHNSARSQMAEAYLKRFGKKSFKVESAGIKPGKLNFLAVQAMDEEGIDISENATKSVFDLHKKGLSFDYVITVCDPEAAEMCPVFPGVHKKINWPFEDPGKFRGVLTKKLERTRKVRDAIKDEVLKFVAEHKQK